MAITFVRTSSTVDRLMPVLRKCSALINRDEAAGVIVQRIIGSDQRILHGLHWILASLPNEGKESKSPLTAAIEFLGWPMIREVTLVVLMHEIHCETASRLRMKVESLDQRCLALMTAGTEIGASNYASLFANVGEIAMALHEQGCPVIQRETLLTSEDLVRAEQRVFGFDHGTLSAAMLREVDFPSAICEEVAGHTSIGTPIWIGEQLCADLGYRGAMDRGFKPVDLWHTLNLSEIRLERLKANIQSAADLSGLAFMDTFADVA